MDNTSNPETLDTRGVLEALAAGHTIGDIAGRDPAELEAMYQTGYELYQGGRYADAAAVFGFLSVNNHLEPRYHFAYAGALQMHQDWGAALRMYTLVATFNFADPVPSFHIAECLLALGMKAEAREALQTAIEQCEGDAAHTALRERAKALLALIPRETTPSTKES